MPAKVWKDAKKADFWDQLRLESKNDLDLVKVYLTTKQPSLSGI